MSVIPLSTMHPDKAADGPEEKPEIIAYFIHCT